MKTISSTVILLLVMNFVYSQDSTKNKTPYPKGHFLISSNLIFGGFATTGDTVPNQHVITYGLKPVLQYFFIDNWSIGAGLAYRRTSYKLNSHSYSPENHFDLVLSSSYYLRTHKSLSHFFELMYMGGEQANFTDRNKSEPNSIQPFTNKLRYTYGMVIRVKNWEHIELGAKLFYQQHLNPKKEGVKNYCFLNTFINYNF